jgi:DinB superfamily
MRPMSTIRRWHFDQLRNSLKAFRYIVQTTPPVDLITYRDSGEGWTSAEVIGHLLDCERLFLERARLTIAQDNPDLPFPDQNEDVIKGHYNERDPQAILADWQQTREEYLAYLGTIEDDASWNREGKHPKYAPFSLNDQLFLICWHDSIHLEQLARILTEK